MVGKKSFVYIMANNRMVLYIGITSNLVKRVFQHKKLAIKGFTKKYNLTKLIYYEVFEDIESAIKREKQLKNWHREWKLNLIKTKNPEFNDLYQEILK